MLSFLFTLSSSGIFSVVSAVTLKYQSLKYSWTPLESFPSNGIGECARICRRRDPLCFGFAFDAANKVCEIGYRPVDEDPNGKAVYKFQPGDCRSDVAKTRGYIYMNDKWWVALEDEVSSWQEARQLCQDSGGWLGFFASKRHWKSVEHLLSGIGANEFFWSALVLDESGNRPCDTDTDPQDCDGVYRFGNNTLEWGEQAFTEWAPSLLSRNSGPGFCGVVHRSPTTGKLVVEDQPCDWESPDGSNRVLCQIDCYNRARKNINPD